MTTGIDSYLGRCDILTGPWGMRVHRRRRVGSHLALLGEQIEMEADTGHVGRADRRQALEERRRVCGAEVIVSSVLKLGH